MISRRIGLAALMLLLPCAVTGQQIDYGLLFDQHAAELRPGDQIDGRAVDLLSMPEGIELRRLTGANGEVSYTGIDSSGRGAVGCLYQLFFELDAMAKTCDWTPPKREARVLEERLRRIARFVMANSVPAMNPDRVTPYLAQELAHWQQGAGAQACAEPDHGLQGFAAALASEGFEAVLDTALEVPRLPVNNPCL